MKKQKRLNNREIAGFCSQISMLQQAGIAPAEGMSILLSDVKTTEAKEIYERILEVCSQGEPFYEGVKAAGVFPDYVIHMIQLGEDSGNLDDVMQSLSLYYDHEEDIAESIHSAISYPFIMIGMMIVVILVLIMKVLPIFQQVFRQLGTEMTGFSASLLSIGDTLNNYGIILIAILAILLCLYIFLAKTTRGKAVLKAILIRFPLTRGFYEDVAIGRFASGMSLTMGGGMDTYQSLDLVHDLVEHASMEAKIDKCKEALLAGANFSEAITAAGIFSNFYARMITVGFRTGSIDSVLTKIADSYDEETTRKLSRIISILEPTLVIILSLIVGLILLSVILPLMGIMSSIG